MSIEHVNITDPNIHEPKGAYTAAIDTAYLSDGNGSGAWRKTPTQGLAGISGNGSSNQLIVVDGAGGHTLQWGVAHGAIYFVNLSTPNVTTYPSSYTKLNPVTTAGGLGREFTEGTNARLTYTGALNRRIVLRIQGVFSQTTGANRDFQLAIYKNGTIVANSETINTFVPANKYQFSTNIATTCATNDYFEVYIRNNGAGGDVSCHEMRFMAEAYLS